jgi:hypothetical protein
VIELKVLRFQTGGRHQKSPPDLPSGEKNKRGYIEKWDQTESPEIPDRGEETSEIPGLPSGGVKKN